MGSALLFEASSGAETGACLCCDVRDVLAGDGAVFYLKGKLQEEAWTVSKQDLLNWKLVGLC